MKNTFIMTWFTLREAMARKVFIFFLVISAIVLLITGLVLSMIDTEKILTGLTKGAVNIDMSMIVSKIELMIVSPLAGLCLLLAIFASASFIPIMLEKGNIDLLLSKPVSRSQLIWGKFWGGLMVVFLNIAFLIIGVWLIISFKFSYWNFSFLLIVLITTFTFAVLYSLIILFGVLTKGSTLGMMVAYFIFIILSPLLASSQGQLGLFIQSKFWKSVIDAFYYIVPKTSEMMGKISFGLAAGNGVEDWQPILTSLAFLILTMGITISIFRKKDF